MNKWVALAAAALALAWGPFLYAELTSEPAEKRARDLPSDHGDDEDEEVVIEEEEEAEEEPEEPEEVELAEEPEPEEPSEEAELEEPGEELAAAELPRTMAAAPNPAEEEAEAEEPSEEGDGEEEPPKPPAVPPPLSGPTAVFKKAFENEPRDALWASETEQQLSGLLSGDDLPADLFQGASCRKTVCQVELQWTSDNAEAYTTLSPKIMEQFGHQIGVEPMGPPSPEGVMQLHLYVLREGYNLHDVAQ